MFIDELNFCTKGKTTESRMATVKFGRPRTSPGRCISPNPSCSVRAAKAVSVQSAGKLPVFLKVLFTGQLSLTSPVLCVLRLQLSSHYNSVNILLCYLVGIGALRSLT